MLALLAVMCIAISYVGLGKKKGDSSDSSTPKEPE
jgi:hypothetical protein